MKKIWVFLLGMLAGMVLLFTIALVVSVFFGSSFESSSTSIESRNGINMFPEKGDCLSDQQFKVLQVLDNGVALANEYSKTISDTDFYSGLTVLFVSETKYYYDEEIIKVPKGKCVRQIGVYSYESKNGYKTVPVVEIADK